MLPSLILNALLGVGLLMVWLAYGRDGWEARKALKKDPRPLAFLFTIGFVCWVFGIAFLFVSVELILNNKWPVPVSYILLSIWAFLFPPIYVLWFIRTRKVTVPAMIKKAQAILDAELEESRNIELEKHLAAVEVAKESGWICTCGRPHANFESSCVCGMTKQQAKEHKQ